jgi:CheY-like chemotaxis protein
MVAMTSLSILVAEDHDIIRDVLQRCLSGAGHKVVCVATGQEAVKLLRERRFNLLITDIFMPDGDGLELIMQATKSDGVLRVLAISGGGKYFHAALGLSAAQPLGAHATLLKPFAQTELFAAMGRAMAGSQRV